MPTLGKDTCPFTGQDFARLRDGRGGTVLVRTPVLRKEVALTSELCEDLPRHPKTERLGFRRWVADLIEADLTEAGTLPPLLTAEHLINTRNHPPPSAEVKAARLLSWMVMERKAKYGIAKEFDFGADRVGATHEACLITETEQGAHLIPFIEILRDRGYVEYPGTPGQTVSSLVVRLTPLGFENAGALPAVQQVAAHIRATAKTTASVEVIPGRRAVPAITVARDTRPAEVEKIVIRTIDRTLVRDRLVAHGADLVAMADELLAQLERALDPDSIRQHNRPPEPLRDPAADAAIERLRTDLQKFRDALAKAIGGPTPKVDLIVKRGGRLVGALKAVADHPIVQRPALGVAAVAVSALATAAGVPVDPTITIGLMLAGPEGAKAVGDAAKRIGGPGA